MHLSCNLLTYFKQVLKACSPPLQYVLGFYEISIGNDFLVLCFFSTAWIIFNVVWHTYPTKHQEAAATKVTKLTYVVWITRVKFLMMILRYFSSPPHTEWLGSVRWTLEVITLRWLKHDADKSVLNVKHKNAMTFTPNAFCMPSVHSILNRANINLKYHAWYIKNIW
jgi:hypothetical protein